MDAKKGLNATYFFLKGKRVLNFQFLTIFNFRPYLKVKIYLTPSEEAYYADDSRFIVIRKSSNRSRGVQFIK